MKPWGDKVGDAMDWAEEKLLVEQPAYDLSATLASLSITMIQLPFPSLHRSMCEDAYEEVKHLRELQDKPPSIFSQAALIEAMRLDFGD